MSRWMHFSNKPIERVEDRTEHRWYDKPDGFWVSDEDEEQSWVEACRQGTVPNDYLGTIAYAVELDMENLLLIESESELRWFHEEFHSLGGRGIDWLRVTERWDGILITPYQWPMRRDLTVSWYYTWDCASGCIWRARAIRSLTQVVDHE